MMKTLRKMHTGDQNCSCTSCVYRRESDNPSLRRIIGQGSRIDRLYYGKYIPLRERKLLEKLVRTRAVYDDIRAKLISDSTISLSNKADSRLNKKLSSKELDDTEKGSGAIFELVDLVDKGATLGLSECCSCCSCSSKAHLQDHKRHKHHRTHFGSGGQIFQKERLDAHRKKKGVRFKAKNIRSDPCTCTFKLSGLFKNNKDLFKKNTPMELYDLQPNEERHPKQKRVRELARRSYENIKQTNKQIGEKVLEGIKKVKESKTIIQERLQLDAQSSAVKLKQTTNRLKANIKNTPPKILSKTNLKLDELLAICMCSEDEIFGKPPKEPLLDVYKQKSKEKIIEAKNKLKSAMKSAIERKPKLTKIKTKTSGTYFAPENDLAFQVKKDSIRKFKEELRRKQIMKEWECDPECIEGICDPEECFIKLKKKHKNMKHRGLEHHIRKHEKKIGAALSQKNEKIQNKVLPVQDKNIKEPPVDKNIQKKPKAGKKRVKKKEIKIKTKTKQKEIKPEEKTKQRQGVRVKSSFSLNFQFYKEIPASETNKANLKESVVAKPTPSGINYKVMKNPKLYRHQRTSQIVIKRSSRDTQTEVRSLKRCFCTLKLKSNKSKAKYKKKYKITTAEKSVTTLQSHGAPCQHLECSKDMCDKLVCEKLVLKKLSNAHTNTENKFKKKRDIKSRQLLPYECEPGVCIPGNCDPYHCIKLINIREAKVNKRSMTCFCPSRKIKSTSTLTSRSPKTSQAKFAQSYTYGPTLNRKEGKAKAERQNIHKQDTSKQGRAPNRKQAIAKVERQYVHNPIGRQAVKIGSTFSFNIEFYKNQPSQHYSEPSELKTFSVKPKVTPISKPKLKERGYQGDVASIHQNMPTQIYRKQKNTSINTTLKRCFCTLKLQRKSHSKLKKKKMFSTGTKTIEEPFMNIVTSTKGTKTKQKYLTSLKPYECEPFTCIPGECNPYECLERINRRNLKDVGVSSTLNRSEINKGSSTSEKSLKAVKTQSKPRSREQKVLAKVKEPKKQIQKMKENFHYTPSAPSKQAVRVGSTFSFNIEFYKKQTPTNNLKTNYQMRPAVKLDTNPITKNKGVKIVKLNVANLNTQVDELKKRNKTSTTKPLLKRCFCTLNLQKKKNNAITTPFNSTKVYTVNRAMVNENRLTILRTHCTKNRSRSENMNIKNSLNGQLSNCVIKSLYNECKILNSNKHLQCQSCCPLIINVDKLETVKSNVNTNLSLISQSYISDNLKLDNMEYSQLVKGSNNTNQYSSYISQERKCVEYTSNNFKKIPNREKGHLIGLRQYLKGYFCTMNLQVVRNRNAVGKPKNLYSDINHQDNKKPRKLKPYECEPGVCVPGECDPYECLKLISKRESNFSKRTGTESSAITTSSYTDHTPKYKSYKVQSPLQKARKSKVSRVYQDHHKIGEKNAVRVGSTFSFDIEFFKKSGMPQTGTKKIKTSELSSIMKPSYPKRTKSYLSKTTKVNKQDFRNQHSQSPFSKTLQKASATLPRMKRCFCTLKLQKKGRLQKEVFKQPSEAMQTEAIVPQLITVDRGQKAPKFKPLKIAQSLKPYECKPGICVPGECNPYECLEIMKRLNYNQTADSGTDANIADSKSIASMTVFDQKYKTRKVNVKPKVYSKTNLSDRRQKIRVQSTKVVKPAKQAVRIGSSFSFNIEFYKSQPSLAYPTKYISKEPPRKIQRKTSEHHTKIKQRSSETSEDKHHKQSQIKNTVQAASTMTTSFMKRCFCVLQLGKNKKRIKKDTNVLKNIVKPVYIDKKTNTKHYKERIMQLEPYECEPGICIPGECDPYVCEKLIKRRNNLRSQSSSTALNSTKTASSSSPRTGTKNFNTQFQSKKGTKEQKKQVYTKTKIHDSNRQAVKIGSNFSFDIEFNKSNTSKIKEYDKQKVKIKNLSHVVQKKKKEKNSGTKSPSVSFKSQLSQMKVNKKDFAAGINNVIKRCFCTLQLQRRKRGISKVKKKEPIKIEVHSKSVMTKKNYNNNVHLLEPYECEPNICIPYECDPYECEKLIKLRQRKQKHREMGIATQHLSKQFASSSTEPFKKAKKRTQSISFKNKDKVVKVKRIKQIQEPQSKQCVKIGSSFSFDIEFFKNKNPVGVQLNQKPQYIQPKLRKTDKTYRKIKTKNQGLQFQKRLHANPSQMRNEFTKTQSTMARFTPPLKRCFCTFYLKRPKKELDHIPKPVTSTVSTETKLRGPKVQPLAKLLPYECEPNVCIPGECNPLECLERIKSRLKQQKDYGTSTHILKKNDTGSSVVRLQTKTRSKRSQFKSLGHVKHRQHVQPITYTRNPNRQAVRIGSNFSFNIDFYKQRGSDNFDRKVSDEHAFKYKSKPLKTTNNKIQAINIEKKVNKKLDHKLQRDHGSQSPYIKQTSKGSAAEPFLKRCFCTLKLQKKPLPKTSNTTLKNDENNIGKEIKPKIVSIDKGTLTKKYKNKMKLAAYECEPFTCIPGECDPYECQKRIEARYLKSKNMSTQMLRQSSQKSVGANLANLNSKKIQSNLLGNLPSKSKVNEESNIVEIPRFGNLFNKQAVKIGSNFSFNIEFYKEILPPSANEYPCEKIECYEEPKPKKTKRNTDAVMTSKIVKNRNKGIQGDSVKTDSKALEVGNALKRCFCTLKLQKELNLKQSKRNIENPKYPQIIEVRRVSVQNKNKIKTKQTFNEVKSVGTKTKAKYLKDDNAICDPRTCRNFNTLSPQEMKVILPYTPSKFNRTPSKTLQNKELFNEANTKPRKTKITNRGKRLTKKKSKKSIHKNNIYNKDLNSSNHSLSNFKKFMCKCAQIFMHKTPDNLLNGTDKQSNNQNEDESLKHTKKKKKDYGIKTMKNDRHSHGDNFEQKSNKSDILKNKHNNRCNENCPYYKNINFNSHYQAGDIAQNPTMSLKMIKKPQNDNTLDAKSNKKQRIIMESEDKKVNEKTKHFQENSVIETNDFFCSHCKNIKMNKRHSQPLKVHFQDTPIIQNKNVGKKTKGKDGTLALLNKSVDHIGKHRKSLPQETIKNDIQSRKLAKYCNYCTTCGAKLNNEEIQKAAGDQKITESVPKEKPSNLHQTASDKVKNLFKFKRSIDNICSAKGPGAKGPEQPLFEMHLDSDDYGIINKDEVFEKVTRLKKKRIKDKSKDKQLDGSALLSKLHGKSCRCCICLGKRNKTGATFNVSPKAKPCVCGSKVCAKKLASMGKELHTVRRAQLKPCDCGSPVCADETEIMNAIYSKEKLTCICAKERAERLRKIRDKKKKLAAKKRSILLEKHNKEDNKRSKERRKRDKLMEKKVNKNASDIILMAESLIDIGKFGVTACTDILRLVARTAIDPKNAYNQLKTLKENPHLISKYFKSGIGDSGIASTGRRIRLRCLSMRGVKNVRSFLERYPITNYLLYIGSKDPKRRLPKRRPRERDQLDFNCSLYMASLRKKPYVSLYNKYPWFYPHFLSMLNVWRQFTDIALFLLAVVVWSPCILCMEACRAIMCCFFCTD